MKVEFRQSKLGLKQPNQTKRPMDQHETGSKFFNNIEINKYISELEAVILMPI